MQDLTKAERFPYLKDLWGHRELLWFLAWRDFKVRYKQAALGVAWAVIQPLFTMIVFAILFGRLARMPSDGIPYPLFSFTGLLLWTYLSGTLVIAGNSLVSNANLVTKVYFPRMLLPAASALIGLLDAAITIGLLAVLMVYYGVQPGWSILLAPLFVFQLFLLTVGIAMLLAAMNVRFRDIKYTIPFVTQLWMYATPIIYPMSFVPEQYRWIIALNPATGIVEGFRSVVLGAGELSWYVTGMSWLVTIALVVLGAVYFRATEREFADIV